MVDIKEMTSHKNSMTITITLKFLCKNNIKGPLEK